MKKLYLLIAVLFLSSVSIPTMACSCIAKSKLKEAAKNADAILIGTIIHTETVVLQYKEPKSDSMVNLGFFITRFDLVVEKIFTGHITKDTVSIYTGNGGGDCGYRFELGETYIIYARYDSYLGEIHNLEFPKGDNIYWTNICSRTAVFDQKESNDLEKYFMRRGRHTK